jgi:iron complex transport system ATP-binding protein
MPTLSLSGLSIRRGDTHILREVSWQIEPGEHWVILGANGSGKTSLLAALIGYLTPTAGNIELFGQRFGRADWRQLRRKVGIVSSAIRQLMPESETALVSVVSGKYAMIDMWGEPSPADEKRARRLLKQIECESLADRPWQFLSQGERQRILIGRALMAEPALLILDEPCAGLDPVAREHFLQFLQRLGRKKKSPALVLVTHHVEEIMPVFSHALLLRKGRIDAAGKISDVMTSRGLSKTFGASMRLEKRAGRYAVKLLGGTGRVI